LLGVRFVIVFVYFYALNNSTMCYFFNIMYKQRLKCILLCIHDLKWMDTT